VSDKQGTDILLLDSRGICSFSDYFIIASGDSERQLKAIVTEVVHILKQQGEYPLHQEGTVSSGWLLVDYGDVILHLFAPPERQIYRLDELWSQSKTVLQIG
jgi:ribosome-associated protein